MKLPLLFAALVILFTQGCGTDPVLQGINASSNTVGPVTSNQDSDNPPAAAGGTDCSAFAGTSACGGFCVYLDRESQHCGQCNNACPNGGACMNGQCSACPAGTMDCGAGCVDVNSDAANCGSCGNSCMGASCVAGDCQCPGGGLACGGSCVEANNPMHCGQCDNACPPLTLCAGGGCMCAPGLSACSNVCVDTVSDGANCGTCGNNCAAQGLFCSGGACTASCPAGTMTCGNSCVDTSSNLQHCGVCNNLCGAGTSCSGGVCGCPAGQALCNGVCVDLQTSTGNCGACGTVCAGGQTCSAGACACPVAGQALCNGSCVDTSTSALNCGACGVACAAGQQCAAGVCSSTVTPVGCPAGQEMCESTCVTIGVCTGGAGAGPVGGGGTPNVPGNGGTVGVGGADPGPEPGPTPVSGNPPGYWESKDWHGCAWTGVDTLGVGSTITPQDFLALPAGDPYCVSGTVGAHAEYESVALLGFNVNEPNTVTCEYEAVTDATPGAPTGTTQDSGIAVNFVKQGGDTAFTWRVQLQGPQGHLSGDAGAADRWCATITEVQGKVFIPYTEFNTACWDGSGTAYSGQPISAISFLVPGAPTATPFDFCVNGFAYGTSAADAPDGSAVAGDQTGTVGGTGNDDLDFDRAKVVVGDEQYILQNNNWGNPGGSDCILDYVNNSFTVTSCTGSNSPAPAAFPSIYIGNNGNTAQGVYSTQSTDNLPRQISAISSLTSTFRYSGGSGTWNATYDIWFANSAPSGEYQDGIDGFVMIWLYDPSGAQPIGSNMGSATIAGESWNYWVGPRGDGPNGYNDAPVISYVNPSENSNSRSQSFVNKNVKEFLTHAAGLNQGITTSMYLTDLFAGFEIWNGGQGLKVDEFTAVVTP